MRGVSLKWAESGNCLFIDYLNAYNNIKIDVSLLQNATVKKLNQNIIEHGDILLTSASETLEECAVSSVVEEEIKKGVFLDDHLFGLRLRQEYKEIVNTSFVNYYFHSSLFRAFVQKAVRGVTRFYISNADFLKLTIPIPPVAVQEEVVRVLDKFTALEAELEAELYCRMRQYQYYRDALLTFDLSPSDGLCHSPLFPAPFAVEWCPLGEVAKIKNGKDYKHLSSGEIPVYGSGGIMTYVDDFSYDQPSVLIPRKGSLNNLFYVNTPFWNVDTIFYTAINSEMIVPKFFYYYLSTLHLERLNLAGGVPSLTQKVLNKLEIPIPPVVVQGRIVEILDKFDTLVNSISEGLPREIELRRKQYEYYRDALLSFEPLTSNL